MPFVGHKNHHSPYYLDYMHRDQPFAIVQVTVPRYRGDRPVQQPVPHLRSIPTRRRFRWQRRDLRQSNPSWWQSFLHGLHRSTHHRWFLRRTGVFLCIYRAGHCCNLPRVSYVSLLFSLRRQLIECRNQTEYLGYDRDSVKYLTCQPSNGFLDCSASNALGDPYTILQTTDLYEP